MGKNQNLALVAALVGVGLSTGSARAIDVWYDFETAAPWGGLTDKLGDDGVQSTGLQDIAPFAAEILGGGQINGSQTLRLRAYNPVAIPTPLNLGPQVTFAAKVRYIFGGYRELFGTYGAGEALPEEIVGLPGQLRISFEPRGTVEGAEGAALRFIYFKAGGNIDVSATGEIASWGNELGGQVDPHHMAVTWDDGVVKLYFDGVEVGSGGAPGGGDLDLSAVGFPLVFGGVHPWEMALVGYGDLSPVCGDIDDVLVLRRALNSTDIMTLASAGATALNLTETTAGEVLYDMEGDSGSFLTDKLGQISAENTTTDERLCSYFGMGAPMMGSQYLRLECHTAVLMTETKTLGTKVTLAAHVRDVPGGIRYLITNSLGSGVAGEVIVWFDSTGTASGQALRFLHWDSAGNLAYNIEPALPIPDWSRAAGNTAAHHIAVTWDDGLVSLYFDGTLVGSGGAAGGGELNLAPSRRSLRFGGRAPGSGDAQGDSNYAFEGDADDVLVLRRVLAPAEIATLAASGASALGLTESAAGEVLYDMEGDTGDVLTDKLDTMLSQHALFDRGVEMTESANAYVSTTDPLFGSGSGVFEAYNAFGIPDGVALGSQLTLSAHVQGVPDGLRLLFSNYDGFDLKGDFWLAIHASGTPGQSVWFRYVGPGGVLSVTNADALPAWSTESGDTGVHHVAATYNDGEVKVYFDGAEVGSGGLSGQGPLDLGLTAGSDRTLRFGGHDARAFPGTRHFYPFMGKADDIIVLGRVLTAEEIFRLSVLGGEGFFSGAPLPAFPDIDIDGDVDGDDLDLFMACLSAPAVPTLAECKDRDFDLDGDVDQADFATWQTCYQSADVPVGGDCTIRP